MWAKGHAPNGERHIDGHLLVRIDHFVIVCKESLPQPWILAHRTQSLASGCQNAQEENYFEKGTHVDCSESQMEVKLQRKMWCVCEICCFFCSIDSNVVKLHACMCSKPSLAIYGGNKQTTGSPERAMILFPGLHPWSILPKLLQIYTTYFWATDYGITQLWHSMSSAIGKMRKNEDTLLHGACSKSSFGKWKLAYVIVYGIEAYVWEKLCDNLTCAQLEQKLTHKLLTSWEPCQIVIYILLL